MPWKTSFLNKGLIKNDLKRFYWIPALYFICLLFAVPLQIIMKAQHLPDVHSLERIISFNASPFQYFLILIVPVLTAILLFNYLHDKSASDTIHSLPIKRTGIYTSHILVGILFLTVPVIITTVITLFLNMAFDLSAHFTALDILSWLSTTVMMNIMMFMSAVFVGTVTGVAIAQGVFTYILLFLPIGLLYLSVYNLELFLYGMNTNYYMDSSQAFLTLISPIFRITNLSGNLLSINEVLGYAIFCLILYIGGSYLYKARKLERNMETITFQGLGHLFKYGFTFCCMLVAGAYFGSVQDGISWVIFGYVLISCLSFFIAEAILQKSVRVFNKKAFFQYGIYFAIVGVVFLGVKFDVMGYEDNIPNPDKISGVYYSSRGFFAPHRENLLYETEENIAKIQELHREIVNTKTEAAPGRDIGYINIVYQLESGRQVARSYRGVDYSAYAELIAPIHNSLEYKKVNYDVFNLDPWDIEEITIGASRGYKSFTILEPTEINQAISLLRQDIIDTSYDELDASRQWGYIEIVLKDDAAEDRYGTRRHYFMDWNKSFHGFDMWLDEIGYLEYARLTSDDVHFLIVEQAHSNEDIHNSSIIITDNDENFFKSSDQEEIEKCLRASSELRNREHFPQYIVRYYNQHSQQITYETFEEDSVPSFVAEHFTE